MRWEDEHYVKLYVRDTPTWKAMAWQAKAVWPLLMRKLDKAGLMDCGSLGRRAVALMVDLPDEVVTPGLRSLEELGVIAWHGNTLEAPNFEDAQEAKASDIVRKREERRRAKDKARAAALEAPVITNGVSRGVTPGHAVSRPDSPAQPIPSLFSADAQDSERPSPRWQETVAALHACFLELRGKPYRFAGNKDGPALKRLLKVETPEEILLRFRRGLTLGFNPLNTVAQLGSRWNDLAAETSRKGSRDFTKGRVAAEEIDWTGQTSEVSNGL